jgi:2'-hydroxyisoflavone reductase
MMNDGERPVYGFSRAGTSFAMNILLLGGYAFLGRAIIAAAQARGHTVAAFNRGNHPALPGVEQLTGDRNAPAFAAERSWDVAIDTSGQAPRHVRAAAELLRERIGRYIYTSSISVYPFPILPGLDETAPLAAFTEGADPEDARDMENYGARKVACEAVLETLLPGRVLIVRPGFIVGPHDYSDRFNSWVERAARPQPLLVPGDPAQPVQLIDVRDLAEWTIALAERGTTGTFNATGPARPIPLIDVAQTCIAATGSRGAPLVVPSAELTAAGVVPWQHIPFWLEPGEYGIMETNIDRALAAGLRFRPLAQTVRDTYAWLKASDHERKIVFPAELEAAAISRFRAR